MPFAAFTATAGSAAEGKVRDSQEPGSLLFHLRRCHGIQSKKTHTYTQTYAVKDYMVLILILYQQDHVCELLNTIDACQVFFDIVSE